MLFPNGNRSVLALRTYMFCKNKEFVPFPGFIKELSFSNVTRTFANNLSRGTTTERLPSHTTSAHIGIPDSAIVSKSFILYVNPGT